MAVFPYLFVTATTEQLVLQYATLRSKLHLQSEPTATSAATIVDPEDTPEYIRAKETLASSASSPSLLALVHEYASQAALLLSLPDIQVEGLFSLLLAVIQKVAADHAHTKEKHIETSLVQAVLKSIEQASQERGAMKLRLAHHLFNALPATSSLRRNVFDTLVKLAQRHGELKALGTQLVHLPTWVREWQLRAEPDALTLFSDLSNVFAEAGLVEEAYTCLLQVLPILPLRSKAFDSVFTRAVCLGVVGARGTCVDVSGLLPLARNLPHTTPALSVLLAYLAGDVLTLRATLPELRLHAPQVQQALENARIVHLSRLPAGLRLPYTTLAESLVCPATADVERYVTDAVSRGMLVAKLDPIERTVTVVQARPHHFEDNDWKFLQTCLAQWQKKLAQAQWKVMNVEQGDDDDDDDDDDEDDDDEEEISNVAQHDDDNDNHDDDGVEEDEEIEIDRNGASEIVLESVEN